MSVQPDINKLRALSEFDFEGNTKEIVLQNADVIKNLLRSQLSKGIDGLGEPVTIYGNPFYKESTKSRKLKYGVGLGEETRWITNYMTGSFYNLLRVSVSEDLFEITSDVSYYADIINRSSNRIMLLTRDNLKVFIDDILKPQLEQRIKLFTGGI